MSSEDLMIIEIDGKWAVAIKEKYDEEWERSLIAVGKSREEALELAIKHSVEHCNMLEQRIDQVCQALKAENDLPYLSRYQEVDGVTTEINGECVVSLDAICKGDDAAWNWYFR